VPPDALFIFQVKMSPEPSSPKCLCASSLVSMVTHVVGKLHCRTQPSFLAALLSPGPSYGRAALGRRVALGRQY